MVKRVTNMPKLIDIRKTKEITLPSYTGSKIVIYDSVIMRDSFKVLDGKDNPLRLLQFMIKEWNFTDDNDKILPINEDSFGLLKAEDATFLVQEITKFTEESKKK